MCKNNQHILMKEKQTVAEHNVHIWVRFLDHFDQKAVKSSCFFLFPPQLLFLLLSLMQLCNQVYTLGQQGLMGYWTTPCNWLEVSLPPPCTNTHTQANIHQCKQNHIDLAERVK